MRALERPSAASCASSPPWAIRTSTPRRSSSAWSAPIRAGSSSMRTSWSSRMCGVAHTTAMPSRSASRAIATLSARSSAPSSSAGRMWQWRSITTAAHRRGTRAARAPAGLLRSSATGARRRGLCPFPAVSLWRQPAVWISRQPAVLRLAAARGFRFGGRTFAFRGGFAFCAAAFFAFGFAAATTSFCRRSRSLRVAWLSFFASRRASRSGA